jgi:hypothetical protein
MYSSHLHSSTVTFPPLYRLGDTQGTFLKRCYFISSPLASRFPRGPGFNSFVLGPLVSCLTSSFVSQPISLWTSLLRCPVSTYFFCLQLAFSLASLSLSYHLPTPPSIHQFSTSHRTIFLGLFSI